MRSTKPRLFLTALLAMTAICMSLRGEETRKTTREVKERVRVLELNVEMGKIRLESMDRSPDLARALGKEAVAKLQKDRAELALLKKELAERAAATARIPVEDRPIEKYSFKWDLVETGALELSVEKTEAGTCMTMFSRAKDIGYLRLEPGEAEVLGEALKKTDEILKKLMAGADDGSEMIEGKAYDVTFKFSKVAGASVLIEKNERLGLHRGLELTAQEATSAFPFLLKATKLIQRVEVAVKP